MDGVTRRACLALGAVPVVAGAAAYVAKEGGILGEDPRPRFRPARPGGARAAIQERHLVDVPLVTHDGRNVRFYDDLVRNKKVVLTFVSSRAPAESVRVLRNLRTVQRAFGIGAASDVFLYTIARDPDRDAGAAMARAAARSGAGPNWTFLTGAAADVERLRHGLGFASDDPAEDADPRYAVSILRYGSEPDMLWGHCQSQAPARVIAHSLLMDFGPGAGASPVATTFGGGSAPGAAPIWNCRLLTGIT